MAALTLLDWSAHSYGNFDPPLAYLNEQVLGEFEARPVIRSTTQVPLQKPWSESHPMQEFACPPDSMVFQERYGLEFSRRS